MTPLLMRQIWSALETASPADLAQMGHEELTQLLSQQIESRFGLSPEESSTMKHYLRNHIPLIRDLLESGGFGV